MSGAIGDESLVAVAFSGGLDSSVVAQCALRHADVVACSAFASGSVDASRVRQAAEALRLELRVTALTKENVEQVLGTVDLPFEPTLMDKSLWCLYSLVSRSAHESGARVMLLGQLADELFGGYAKYAEALRERGIDAAKSMMEADLDAYPRRGRLRDVRACGRMVEARFPFEVESVVDFAAAIPTTYKLRDGARKAVLRRAALLLGVPEGLAEATKKAAQYSSGVQKLVAGSRF